MHRLSGQRLYLDANALIYFIEAHPSLGDPVRAIFQMALQGQVSLVTSELSLAEALVLPFKLGRTDLINTYQRLIVPAKGFQLIGIDRTILIESSKLRALTGSKLPDAIHVTTASLSQCAIFISEDRNIRIPAGPQQIRISELVQDGAAETPQ
jgi:predicted nucleic acid-binding protein